MNMERNIRTDAFWEKGQNFTKKDLKGNEGQCLNQNENNLRSDLKSTTKAHFQTTSLRGVAKSCKSDSWPLRVFWMLGFVGGSAIAVWLLMVLVQAYLQHSIVTKVQYSPNAKPEFPDITVCSLNTLPLLNDIGGVTFYDYIDSIQDELVDFEQLREQSDLRLDRFESAIDHLYTLTGFINNFNSTLFWDMYQQYGGRNWIVHECILYDWSKSEIDYDCSAGIYHVFNGMSQLCYTIQPDARYADKISEMRAWLYVHDFMRAAIDVYIPFDTLNEDATKGIRLFIHGRETFPNVNQGFDVSTGTNVVLNLKADHYRRLSEPYEGCNDQKYLDNDPKVHQSGGIKYRYSTDAMKSECFQFEVLESCECYSPYLPLTPKLTETITRRNLSSCLLYQHSDVANTLQHIDCFTRISYGTKCSGFTVPCEETSYTYDSYQNEWPVHAYKMAFYNKIINRGGLQMRAKFGTYFENFETIANATSENRTEALQMMEENDLIEKNFVQLKVRFQSTGMTKHESVPALTLPQLVGGLGGIFNLWIGFSFITVLECFELMYKYIAIIVKNKMKTKSKVEHFNG